MEIKTESQKGDLWGSFVEVEEDQWLVKVLLDYDTQMFVFNGIHPRVKDLKLLRIVSLVGNYDRKIRAVCKLSGKFADVILVNVEMSIEKKVIFL